MNKKGDRAEFIEKKVHSLRKLACAYNDTYIMRGSDLEKIPLKKPIFYGLQYRCTLKPFAAARYAGMEEAVEAAGQLMLFSTYEPRKCNLKQKNFTYDEIFGENKYFGFDNWYLKGKLGLNHLSDHEYDKLSDAAKKWFIRVRAGIDWMDREIWVWEPKIPAGYLVNICEKVYIINQSVDKSEDRALHDWISNHTDGGTGLYWYWGQDGDRGAYHSWEQYHKKLERRRLRYSAAEAIHDGLLEYEEWKEDVA